MKKKLIIAGLVLLILAISPWFEDDLLSAGARREIGKQIQAEGLSGNKTENGELICDGLCVDRYPFFTQVEVDDASWVVPFWGAVYRVR